MDEFLEESSGRVPSTRNGTDMSRFCDSLIARFLERGMAQAKVAWGRAGFDQSALYRGLWNASNKREFRGRVTVRKCEDEIVLTRVK